MSTWQTQNYLICLNDLLKIWHWGEQCLSHVLGSATNVHCHRGSFDLKQPYCRNQSTLISKYLHRIVGRGVFKAKSGFEGSDTWLTSSNPLCKRSWQLTCRSILIRICPDLWYKGINDMCGINQDKLCTMSKRQEKKEQVRSILLTSMTKALWSWWIALRRSKFWS